MRTLYHNQIYCFQFIINYIFNYTIILEVSRIPKNTDSLYICNKLKLTYIFTPISKEISPIKDYSFYPNINEKHQAILDVFHLYDFFRDSF